MIPPTEFTPFESLLFGEVELMETLPEWVIVVRISSAVASLRRSGINGNLDI